MIEVSYGKLLSPELAQAFGNLASYNGFTSTTAYRIGRMKEFLNQAVRRVTEKKLELAKLYGELDASGKPAREPGDMPGMTKLKIKPEHKDAYDDALGEVYKEVFAMKVHRVPFAELEKAQLTPDDMWLLADFIDGAPEDDDGEENTKE